MGKQTPHGSLANRTIRIVSLVDEVRQKFSSVALRAVVSLEPSLTVAYPVAYILRGSVVEPMENQHQLLIPSS
jgi:hypothetical protein